MVAATAYFCERYAVHSPILSGCAVLGQWVSQHLTIKLRKLRCDLTSYTKIFVLHVNVWYWNF